MVLAVHVVLTTDWVAIFVEEDIDKLLVHRLVERDSHWSVALHTERGRAVEDPADLVTGQGDGLVSLGKDLHCRGNFIGVDHLTFVAFEGAAGNEDDLTSCSCILDSLIKLALLECQVIGSLIVLREGLIDKLKACIDDLVAFDGIDPVSLT